MKLRSTNHGGEGPKCPGAQVRDSVKSMERVISKNVNGLQQGDKYAKFLRYINSTDRRDPVSAVLIQEHNLTSENHDHHQAIARRLRVLALISYMPTTSSKGGTAIFIPYDRIQRRNANAQKGKPKPNGRPRQLQARSADEMPTPRPNTMVGAPR